MTNTACIEDVAADVTTSEVLDVSSIMLSEELHRFGLVTRNADFFTNPVVYWSWFQRALTIIGDIPTKNRMDCYKMIRERFHPYE
ncbi:hypothetical protein HY483_02840 [Candidatus Woesearchaeota archaeon]|nr:hypothetical protein [Candidatus Woesearchaeota archaeon]